MSQNQPHNVYLHGSKLIIAAILLAAANFIVILDMTIANVLVPHIAGSLGASTNEGTYVITSYSIAEVITVPLTGWLALRYGTVHMFTACMFFFGICSGLCALSHHLEFLVMSRILQGLSGGPLMPLSQTLLMLIFPPEKRMLGMAIWSITTLVAPITGPIVGGMIGDNWGWQWAFIINIPLAAACSALSRSLFSKFETPLKRTNIDRIGLLLLILFVSSLQLMLDEGEKFEWFDSSFIMFLCVTAILSCISFIVWELKQENPIVNLSVFRHSGFTMCVVCMSLTFGGYFGTTVLTPLWLQINMGYTATWAGLSMASNGILAICMAPIVTKLVGKVDVRRLISLGVLWIGFVTFIRSFGTSQMTFFDVALPILFQGAAMPFFFIPLNVLALSSVDREETATAAGLLSFIRTISGAFATSIAVTLWDNLAKINRSEIVSSMSTQGQLSVVMLDRLVDDQSMMLATNQMLLHISVLFVIAALAIWFAPRPKEMVQGAADINK